MTCKEFLDLNANGVPESRQQRLACGVHFMSCRSCHNFIIDRGKQAEADLSPEEVARCNQIGKDIALNDLFGSTTDPTTVPKKDVH